MGSEQCSACSGKGTIACWQCGSKGYNDCSACGGRGSLGYGSNEALCTSCGGARLFTCYACSRGQASCARCYGSGNVYASNPPANPISSSDALFVGVATRLPPRNAPPLPIGPGRSPKRDAHPEFGDTFSSFGTDALPPRTSQTVARRTPKTSSLATRSSPIDDKQFGLIPRKSFKWTVLLMSVTAAVAAALWWGVREADRAWTKQDPNGGLTRYATSQVFPGEKLAATSMFLSVKDEGNTLQGTALVTALRAVKRPFAVADPRNAKLLASAYRCQSSDLCRFSVARDAPELQIPMLDLAVAFLGNKTKAGSEPAARDGCLLPLLTGTTPQAVFLGRHACAMMVAANRNSRTAHMYLAKMEGSSWLKLAGLVAAEGL